MAKNTEPTFFIDNVPIYGDLVLAPMDGITDLPFRGLCRQLGSAMTTTEFINALDVIEGNPRYIKRLAFKPNHRPISLQILGDQPERMLVAAEQLIKQVEPDIIDINMGCQSKNVTARGAGAALMKTPDKIARIFQLMTKNFNIPITGKIRLGWDRDYLNYLEIAKVIQDNGGSMVAVHGRTRKQAYHGKARWEPIREVKQTLNIPVLGNGDVENVSDINDLKKLTGCDAVMIGRAAVGNPWIFSYIDRQDVPGEVIKRMIFSHLDAMVDFYGTRGVIIFRKFLKAYLKPYDILQPNSHSLLKSEDPDDIKNQVNAILLDK